MAENPVGFTRADACERRAPTAREEDGDFGVVRQGRLRPGEYAGSEPVQRYFAGYLSSVAEMVFRSTSAVRFCFQPRSTTNRSQTWTDDETQR